jgi:Flp pilus assembly protein TadG
MRMRSGNGWLLARSRTVLAASERGSAIVEFVFVAILVMVPLVYLVVAIAVVQRANLAVTNAAREVGRAIATADSPEEAGVRAEAALRLALQAQSLEPSDVDLVYVDISADCGSPSMAPMLTAGAEFGICVTRHQQLPAVPTVISGRGITLTGRYNVHIDDFRSTK